MPPLLNRLIRHGRAGYLLRAGTLLDAQLAAATQLAQDRLARRPLCFKGQASRQGKILLTVVQSFFVGQVQPWASDVSRIHYQALAAHRQLEARLDAVVPPAYRQWAATRDQQLQALQQATRTHVDALKPLLQSCGLLPG